MTRRQLWVWRGLEVEVKLKVELEEGVEEVHHHWLLTVWPWWQRRGVGRTVACCPGSE